MTPDVQNVFITGACGGLGQALAQQWIARGAQVALVGMNQPVLETLHQLAPERTAVYTPDVCELQALKACAQEWMERAGLPSLVIANAGVAGGFDTECEEDFPVLRRMLEINVIGVANTFHPFLKAMKARQSGALVAVASVAGWRGMPGNAAYCASKAAVIRYMESLRAELRPHHVRAHTVSPGYIKTPLTAGNAFSMPGLMEADEAARLLIEGVQNGVEHLVLPRRIGYLSKLLNLLPAQLHDALLLRQPRKPKPGESGSSPIPGLKK